MEIELTEQEKRDLDRNHRVQRDGRVRDRIKAVLLKSEGWTNEAIAQALRIHADTVSDHLKEWLKEKKLKPENGGSLGKLNAEQTQKLDRHLQKECYTKVIDICAFVLNAFGKQYTVSGMTKWLQEHDFSYKQPKVVPAKLNAQAQEQFIDQYLLLTEQTPADEPIIFIDAVHPTMATKVSNGWIKRGTDKLIAKTASRTRVNVIGGIKLDEMRVHSTMVETVNTETTTVFLDQLRSAYPQAPRIHVILDQAGYHRSQELQNAAKTKGIELHYLPPYSPNLNPIERLWKVMNEQVRNNILFESARAFREAIANFLDKTVLEIKPILQSRINDNFQVLRPASSG
jgi:transposase